MTRREVESWVGGYERAWRTAGTGPLRSLFTDDATYLVSPWKAPIRGLAGIEDFWEAGRDGPDEGFTMTTVVLAVEDEVAIVRAEVDYERGSRWRDLWVLRFGVDGRCAAFEEWPFAPGQHDGH